MVLASHSRSLSSVSVLGNQQLRRTDRPFLSCKNGVHGLPACLPACFPSGYDSFVGPLFALGMGMPCAKEAELSQGPRHHWTPSMIQQFTMKRARGLGPLLPILSLHPTAHKADSVSTAFFHLSPTLAFQVWNAHAWRPEAAALHYLVGCFSCLSLPSIVCPRLRTINTLLPRGSLLCSRPLFRIFISSYRRCNLCQLHPCCHFD